MTNPYRRLPSHNTNSDVRSLSPVSQLDGPDSRLRIRWCPTFLKPSYSTSRPFINHSLSGLPSALAAAH
jgi:hypothetical protein